MADIGSVASNSVISNTNVSEKPSGSLDDNIIEENRDLTIAGAIEKKLGGGKDASGAGEDIDNILQQFSETEIMDMAEKYATDHDLIEYVETFRKGGAIARDPKSFESMSFLDEEDKTYLRDEIHNKWKQPKELFWLVIMCSMGAAIQGMDETVINGANLFYPHDLGIGSNSSRDKWLQGLVNSAPYLCASCISCWLADPMNKILGRRGTIFITAIISFATCFWQGFTTTWYHLFVARFFLGFGIGPKSATIPVYAAECAPANIRGALVMMWQMWTAFGIMFGYVSSLAFYYVKDRHNITGLNWRLMLGSALLPAIFVCAQVLFCPESPRWLISKSRERDAFKSLMRLRNSPLQAARDCFYTSLLLEQENTLKKGRNRLVEMFTVMRNRNATLASWLVMFGQQFCGINVIAYYSSSIFIESGFSEISALLASWGFGMVNFVFALPAVFTIDKLGRRTLLLITFPLMGIFLLIAGFAFWIDKDEHQHARVGVISFGIYMFSAVYSCGEGPVPFTYSAEAFPLYIRDLGMAWATATCWFFNFILSVTWPSLLEAFKPQGAFGWYAAWNFILWVLFLLFLPETKNLTLEELDTIFAVPTQTHAKYQVKNFWLQTKKSVFRRDVKFPPPLYAHRVADFIHWDGKPTTENEATTRQQPGIV